MPYVQRLNPNVDVFFFTGKEPCLVDDTMGDLIHLDCPDDYQSLPQKTYKLAEYALSHGYDLLLKCDDDTFMLEWSS